jgi:hypothetical protein
MPRVSRSPILATELNGHAHSREGPRNPERCGALFHLHHLLRCFLRPRCSPAGPSAFSRREPQPQKADQSS